MAEEENEHEETVLGDCESELIANLVGHAVAHDKGGEPCLNYRTELVARLMFDLDLGVVDLGFIADRYLDLMFSEHEHAPAEDNVLDAVDLFQS